MLRIDDGSLFGTGFRDQILENQKAKNKSKEAFSMPNTSSSTSSKQSYRSPFRSGLPNFRYNNNNNYRSNRGGFGGHQFNNKRSNSGKFFSTKRKGSTLFIHSSSFITIKPGGINSGSPKCTADVCKSKDFVNAYSRKAKTFSPSINTRQKCLVDSGRVQTSTFIRSGANKCSTQNKNQFTTREINRPGNTGNVKKGSSVEHVKGEFLSMYF